MYFGCQKCQVYYKPIKCQYKLKQSFTAFSFKENKSGLILFDLILLVPVNNFSVMSGLVSWVEQVLSKD